MEKERDEIKSLFDEHQEKVKAAEEEVGYWILSWIILPGDEWKGIAAQCLYNAVGFWKILVKDTPYLAS